MGNLEGTIGVTPADFNRLEGKVDQMATAIGQLVLIEDRQTRHTTQLDKGERRMEVMEAAHRAFKEDAEKEMTRIDRRVDKWLYLGTGACAVVSVSWQIFQAFAHR